MASNTLGGEIRGGALGAPVCVLESDARSFTLCLKVNSTTKGVPERVVGRISSPPHPMRM